MRPLKIAALAAALASLPVIGAEAYVGPGAGLSLLGALWGFLVAIVLAVGFVVFWPLRRILLARKRSRSGGRAGDREPTPSETRPRSA